MPAATRFSRLRPTFAPGILSACLCALLPTSAFALQIELRDTVLDNGLQVIGAENLRVPLTTVLLAIRAGSTVQPPHQRGIAHLFEHLLFRTYGREPSDFAQEVARLNGTYNGGTGEDAVTYYVITPAEGTDGAIRLLGRMVSDADIDEDDLEAELPVVLDELGRREGGVVSALERRMAPALWGDGMHQKDLLGDSVSLSGLSVNDLRTHFETYYSPGNAALIVTGAVSWQDVVEAAERHFGDWEGQATPAAEARGDRIPELAGTRAVLLEDDVYEGTVRVALRGPGRAEDPAAYQALWSVARVLNHESSPFQMQMVENGPFDRLSLSITPAMHVSRVEFLGTASNERVGDAVVALAWALNNLSSFLQTGASQLQATSRDTELTSVLRLEQTAILAPYLARWWQPGAGLEWVQREELSSREEILEAAGQYLQGRPMVLGVAGSPEVLEVVRGRLGMGGSR